MPFSLRKDAHALPMGRKAQRQSPFCVFVAWHLCVDDATDENVQPSKITFILSVSLVAQANLC
jgi:hypothetical protein